MEDGRCHTVDELVVHAAARTRMLPTNRGWCGQTVDGVEDTGVGFRLRPQAPAGATIDGSRLQSLATRYDKSDAESDYGSVRSCIQGHSSLALVCAANGMVAIGCRSFGAGSPRKRAAMYDGPGIQSLEPSDALRSQDRMHGVMQVTNERGEKRFVR